MIGDHHVELRRSGGVVELFVSDATRRPVRPRAAYLSTVAGGRVGVAISGDRLMTPAPSDEFEIEIQLQNGTTLRWSGVPSE